MEQIPGQMWLLLDDLFGDSHVPRRRREHAEPRRAKQDGDEAPRPTPRSMGAASRATAHP
jgi:hypothetical protein